MIRSKESSFNTFVSNLPHLLGLPVLDQSDDDTDQSYVHFYIACAILICSLLIISLPQAFHPMTYLLSFSSKSSLVSKIIGSLTANFIHWDFFHLFGNMYLFLIFAPLLEKKFGPINFIIIFVFCSLFSNFSTLFFMKSFYSVGASGTLSGFMALIAITEPKLKFRMYKFFVLPCWLLVLGLYIVPNIIAEYIIRKTGHGDSINHCAHIFGFIAGFLMSLAIQPLTNEQRKTQINRLKAVNLSWLFSYQLWGELLVAIICSPCVFLMHQRSFERTLAFGLNCYLCFYGSKGLALVWAVFYVLNENVSKEAALVQKTKLQLDNKKNLGSKV